MVYVLLWFHSYESKFFCLSDIVVLPFFFPSCELSRFLPFVLPLCYVFRVLYFLMLMCSRVLGVAN
jgi:hypothetical protein